MATNYNIDAYQGSTLSFSINCQDSDGNYINLSGYSARGQVKKQYSSTDILFNLNPTIDTSYVSGLVNISGNATGLAILPVGIFVYDVELYNSGGYVFKPIQGYLSLYPESTNI